MKGTLEENSHEVAISSTGNFSPAGRAPGRSTAAVCTDTLILHIAAGLSRPKPNAH